MLPIATHRHYKGQLYRLMARALHSETQEPLVVYQGLYGDYQVWVRPAALFDGWVDHEGQRVRRFEPL